MAEKKLNVENHELVTSFMPTATPVVDQDGNKMEPGVEALEEQRAQFEDAQKVLNDPEVEEVESEDKDLTEAAVQKAAKDGTSTAKAKEQIEKNVEEDKKLAEKDKAKKEAKVAELKALKNKDKE